MNARPTLDDLRACHARSNACLSWRRLSSRWRAACRRCAAALAPGPSWQSLSIRQSAFARTIVTLIALLISPTTLPSCPGPASQPCALLIAATLDSAKMSNSLWRSGDRSPQNRTILTNPCSRFDLRFHKIIEWLTDSSSKYCNAISQSVQWFAHLWVIDVVHRQQGSLFSRDQDHSFSCIPK